MTRALNRKKCLTCRSKRVKCDEQRPVCGQCRRSCLRCEVSDPSIIFINETPSSISVARPHLRSSALIGPDRVESTGTNSHQYHTRRRIQALWLDLSIPAALSSTAFVHKALMEAFLEQCLPPPRIPCALSWLRHLWNNRDNKSATIRTALQNIALSWTGQSLGRSDFVQEGLRSYSAVLHHFRRVIFSLKRVDVFVIAALLIVYELIQFKATNDGAWRHHLVGAAGALDGPPQGGETNDPYIRAFFFCRSIAVRESLRDQKQPSFPIPTWISSSPEPLVMGPFEHLLDLSIEAAELLSRSKTLPTASEQCRGLAMLEDLLGSLASWMKSASDSAPANDPGLYSELDSPDTGNKGPLGAPHRTTSAIDWSSYEHINRCRLILLYWTVRLHVVKALAVRIHEEMRASFAGCGCSSEPREAPKQYSLATAIAEADQAAQAAQILARKCLRSPWPSFGNMLETWGLGACHAWDQTKGNMLVHTTETVDDTSQQIEA